jgi:3-methyl-2-oxobutanoate hydroxymethyltransferase
MNVYCIGNGIARTITFFKELDNMKKTAATLLTQKQSGEKITMLTAYDYTTAKIADECGIDSILVGDSLGMVMLGYDTTLPVTMEDMIHHTKPVAKAAQSAFVVADMPFMSYQTSVYDAVVNAGRLVQEGGAHAVKLEGGAAVCDRIKAIVDSSIPVVAHLGLTPQSVNVFGGFKVQGKNYERAKQIVEDALKIQQAGACAVVLECVPEKLAKIISEALVIPTIGIGGGKYCDGQVLVYQDALGMTTGHTPKFAKKFADVGQLMRDGIGAYISETRSGDFPAAQHTFKIDDEIVERIQSELVEEN